MIANTEASGGKRSKSEKAITLETIGIMTNDQQTSDEPFGDSQVRIHEDRGTQVDFLTEPTDFNIFFCNLYCSNKGVREAETQASFSLCTNKKKIIETQKKVADKNCGTDIEHEDKSVGPDAIDSLDCSDGFHGYRSIKNDQDMLDLAGVNIKTFHFLSEKLVHHPNEKLSVENRLLLFLFRMKLGLTFSAIGILFNVHRTTAAKNFKLILQFLSQVCRNIVMWPSKEAIQETMPDAFKEVYGNCRVIIDCTEFRVEKPPELNQRVFFYSNYKKGFTLKILVGCTPRGFISFVSECYGGRTTDLQIVNSSGFLNLLEPGDMILADKGFPEIQTMLNDKGEGVLIVMPPFLRDNHFTADQVRETHKIASARIHIERIMARLKAFQILSKFTTKMLPYCNDIVYMCCILCNLQPPILKNAKDVDSFEETK